MQLCLKCTRSRNIVNEGQLLTIPYVPNAIKDHYRRLEELKRVEDMEIASQRRSLKLQEENQALHVLKIQRAWRGFEGRKNIDSFLKERRLWFEQRVIDIHHRSKLGYRVACFFGGGTLLDSATARETVMKKVPFWTRNTVIDLVQGRSRSVWIQSVNTSVSCS